MSAYGDDDYQPQSYQDDLTTDDNVADPVMREVGEDMAEEIGVPADKLRDELKKLVSDDLPADAQRGDQAEHDDYGSLIEDEDDDGTLRANES
jgi:hypothetical protein